MSFDALIAWASTIKYFIDFAVLKIVFIKSMKWIHWGYLLYGFNILVVKHKKSINSQNRLNSQNCLNSQKFLNSQNHICFGNFFLILLYFSWIYQQKERKSFPWTALITCIIHDHIMIWSLIVILSFLIRSPHFH